MLPGSDMMLVETSCDLLKADVQMHMIVVASVRVRTKGVKIL